MSNLIVMPGSKEFEETLARVKRPKKAARVEEPVDLVGRTLMLNTALARTFQCGGFHLGARRPFAIVTEEAQQIPLRAAIAAGTLIDVTGQDLTKGYKGNGGQTSAVTKEDTGIKVFITTDGHGNLCVVAPKSKADTKRLEREVRDKGRITSANLDEQFTGLSKVIEEELEPKPVKTAKKAVKNGSSPSRKGRSRG